MSRVVELIEAGDYDGLLALLRERKRTPNDVRDTAGGEGAHVHDALELYAREGVIPNPADYPAEVAGLIRAAALFLTDYRPAFLATEVVVGSAEHGFAGTFDARAEIAGRIGLLDWKTSKSLRPTYGVQLHAYDLAAQEMGSQPAEFLALVHLTRDGDYTYFEVPPFDPSAFVHARKWYSAFTSYERQFKKALKGNAA
ncbi:MAG: hypothetical protein ACRDLD_02375 [Thermoleophilaceae bacterium]